MSVNEGIYMYAYNDTRCSVVGETFEMSSLSSDGRCTQFPFELGAQFNSFQIDTAIAGCVATIYGNDVPYCSSNRRSMLGETLCASITMVNQFSLDGCTCAAITSSLPVSTSTTTGSNGATFVVTVSTTISASSSSSTSLASAASSGLSTGAKAGIGVGVAFAVIAVLSLLGFFVIRRKRKEKTPAVPLEDREIAYSARGEKKLQHELPHKDQFPAELPPQTGFTALAEAPGDSTWSGPQELKAGKVEGNQRSELASTSDTISDRKL